MNKDEYTSLLALAQKWEYEAAKQIPPEYKIRNLDYKYLKCDNEAAGLAICADELKEWLAGVRDKK
jgi:hypothetical protein